MLKLNDMNKILQKRIEESAFQESTMYDTIQEKNAAYNTGMKIANFALQNQWISVDEALPEEDIPNCFVTYKTLDKVFYSTGSYEKDIDEWYVDSVGFNANVTHYMPIPSLEGGENTKRNEKNNETNKTRTKIGLRGGLHELPRRIHGDV